MMFSDLQTRRQFFLTSAAGLSAGLALTRGARAENKTLAVRVEEMSETHALSPALKIATDAAKMLEPVTNYTAVFHKKEQVGRSLIQAQKYLKLREEPFSVYLKFLTPHQGREALYVAGQHKNQVLVRETGFAGLAGTMALDVRGSFAMEENRYPITSIGLRNMMATTIETWLNEAALDEVQVAIKTGESFNNLKCTKVEITHPHRRANGSKYQNMRLYVDESTRFPVAVQAFDYPAQAGTTGPLIEEYFYANLQVNPGLTEMDFSRKNPQYRLK